MPIAIIANIMFANNISDREEDKIQGRHTLVQYLGLNKSLILFASIYGIGYISIAIVVLLKILPVTALLVFLSFPLVFNNVKIFSKEPIKSKNFVLSIKSAAIICLTLFIGIMIGILI
jgi:1,4-dihydroxy-2-naphthoate octaprenyltransferase